MGSRFDGKVVWITGGGSGIGEALALEFADLGADVAVSGRRKERLEEVVAAIEAKGGKAVAVPCDVTDEDQVMAAAKAVVDAFGQMDVAVANAGYSVSGTIAELTAAEWRRQMDVNVVGAAITAKAALPYVTETKGRIAFVGSVMATLSMAGLSAYAASKFAVRAIGLALAQEVHGTGVSCTTIHPGFVESDIARVDNEGVFDASRKDKRPSKFMWPSDKAAKVMAKAIADRKLEYVFTGHGKVAAFLGRHTPGLLHFVMTRQSNKKRASSVSKNPGASA